jgi:hypothetical protein
MSIVDFDDSSGLMAADLHGDLRSAALAGAQVRAVASAIDEGALAEFDGAAFRSVVLVLGAGPARAAAELVSAALSDAVRAPITFVTALPAWVGALDLVVVCGFDAGDPQLVRAIGEAVRRGAATAVAVPWEGPVAEAGAGRAVPIAPRLYVPERFGFAGIAAALLGVLGTVELGAERTATTLYSVADELDAEALRDHPERDFETNPAKRIAARIRGRRMVLTADTEAGQAVVAHAAGQALVLAGEVVAAIGITELALAAPELNAAPQGGPPAESVDPMFHDPFLDAPIGRAPVRVFVVTDALRRAAATAALGALADLDPILVEEVAEATTGAWLDPALPVRAAGAGWGQPVGALLALAVRFDFAMIYRRLAGEQ